MAPGGQRLHQPAARGHQRQRVLQREDAGQAGGHVLADAVAEHRLRAARPSAIHSRASAYSTTKSAGWVERRLLAALVAASASAAAAG